MKEEKAQEIMSKVLSYWDDQLGIQNCDARIIQGTYKSLLLSPHEDGFMRITGFSSSKAIHLVPFEDIILFGLSGSDIESYEQES